MSYFPYKYKIKSFLYFSNFFILDFYVSWNISNLSHINIILLYSYPPLYNLQCTLEPEMLYPDDIDTLIIILSISKIYTKIVSNSLSK